MQGNYKIEKLIPGWYFLIVRSKNVMGCPDSHLKNIEIYADNFKELFGFEIEKYKSDIDEFNNIDSIAYAKLNEGGINAVANYDLFIKQSRDKAEKIIDALPKEFKNQIQLFTGYSKALNFHMVHIEEGKTTNINTNFGITCMTVD